MSDPITRLNAALEGRYRIASELGEGGMATVYLADDVKHERKVALKVLKPELAAVVGAERFLAEIKTTANLQHPHILPLFDSGEADSFLFYVMPFVEGESLRDRLDREHQLPVDEAVRIATNVAEALDYAHRHGVIHRDIKPANILLQDGKPVLSDFGIALAVGVAGGGRLTETGLSLGTPHYMSPEQATGDLSVGATTDVYALGCVLYEMLVGEPPYTGSTAQAILGKIIAGKLASATEARASVPSNVDAAIRRALEKVPADRFAGAEEFAKALADPGFRHGELAEAGRGGIVARPWKQLSVTFPALFGLATAVAGWALLRPIEKPVSRYSIELPVIQGAQGVGSSLAISPDGTQIVYVGEGEQGQQLWHRRRDQLQGAPIPGTDGAESPVFSPDGARVAFEGTGGISVVSVSGEPPMVIADGQGNVRGSGRCDCWGLGWGADAYVYGYEAGGGLGRVPETGGDMELFTTVDRAGSEVAHIWPQVLPYGGGVLFTVVHAPNTDISQYDIAVADLETGEHEVLVRGVFARYAASGHLVYLTPGGTLLAAPFDQGTLRMGEPVALAEGLSVRPFGSTHLALSEDGTLYYEAGSVRDNREWEFVWVTRSGETEPVQPGWTFNPGGAGNSGWRLSPDDGRVAFKKVVQGNHDIWTKVLPDGPESRLTFNEAIDRMPRWAPDGETVTFRSDRTETLVGHLWSKRADGTGEAEVLFDEDHIAMGFWGPNEEWLILRRSGPAGALGSRDIWAMRPGVDSAAVPLVASEEFGEQGPAISPDGAWLAYSSNETGRPEIFVRPFPDVESGKWQVSTDGGIRPLWSHSGSELFFVDATNFMVAAEVQTDSPFQTVGRQRLFVLPPGSMGVDNADFYDITSDDQRFLMVRPYSAEGFPTEIIVVENFFEELKGLVPN